MSRRSPARFLAPLALVAACATIYLVTESELGDSSSGAQSTSSTSTAAKRTAASKKGKTTKKAARKTYTVKPGDVLGSISQKTGVAVNDLLDYNDLDDAQSLSVGQKLKLAP